MSLTFSALTKPKGLEAKSITIPPGINGSKHCQQVVSIGNYEMTLVDFLALSAYVLTTTDLEPDDPRSQFVKCVTSMREVEGFNGAESKALQPSVEPVLARHFPHT